MTVGSLFSGIGGLDLGFERAGFEIAWQVEIDEWCRRVLTKHWPDVPKYEDVRNVGAHNLERVDVIVAGFPCQDISNAGKRAGITGERSGLWSEYARIVRELRPSYVVVENVAALLHRGLDVVLGELSESGYDAEWQVLPAAAFGAPHIRDRVFILAWDVAYTEGARRGMGNAQHIGALGGASDAPRDGSATLALSAEHGRREGRSGRPPGDGENGQEQQTPILADAEGHAVGTGLRAGKLAWFGWRRLGDGSSAGDFWAVEPSVGRMAHGIPRRVDRLRGLGNAVVPQVAEYVAECVKAHAEAR